MSIALGKVAGREAYRFQVRALDEAGAVLLREEVVSHNPYEALREVARDQPADTWKLATLHENGDKTIAGKAIEGMSLCAECDKWKPADEGEFCRCGTEWYCGDCV